MQGITRTETGTPGATGYVATTTIENNLSVSSDGKVKWGNGTKAEGDYSTAGGFYTKANGQYATAFGRSTEANGYNSTAFGNAAKANGQDATAFGNAAKANGQYSTAFGSSSIAAGDYSTAFGRSTEAKGYNSTAFGNSTQANGQDATAFGYRSIAVGDNSTAFGSYTQAGKLTYKKEDGSETEAKIVEYTTTAGDRKYKIVSKDGNDDLSDNGGAGFYYSDALNDSNLTKQGDSSTAFGSSTIALGDYSTAFGNGSVANAYNSLAALGGTTGEKATNSVAIGTGATVGGAYDSENTETAGANAFAFGNGAQATLSDSVALGSGAVANRAKYNPNNAYKAYLNEDDNNQKIDPAWRATHNAIAVGSDDTSNPVTRQIIGVAAGSADTDAVNVAQLKAATFDMQGITRTRSENDNDGYTYTTTIEDKLSVSSNGAFSISGNKFTVDSDGAISAANGNFTVAADGSLSAGNTTITGTLNAGDTTVSALTVGEKDRTEALSTDGAVTDGNAGYVTGGTVYAVTNALSDRIGTIASDGNYISASASVAGNLGALDTQVKANADKIETKANTTDITVADDGNYITAGSGVAGNLVSLDNAVKANAGTIQGITRSGDGTNGYTTTIEGKLSVSNNGEFRISGDKFTVDSDGAISAASGKFSVNSSGGLTIGSETQNTSVSDTGVTIKDGPSVTTSGIDAGDKRITNVAIAESDTDAVNYKQLRNFVSSMQATGGKFAAGKGLTTVSTKLDDDSTLVELQIDAGEGLGFADNGALKVNAGDGLTIADDGALKVNAGEGLTIDTDNGNVLKVNKGTIAENNTGFVTGGEVHGALALKANTDLDNISDNGKAVVRGLAQDSVKVVDGTNTSVTTGTDGDAITYAVNVTSISSGNITDDVKLGAADSSITVGSLKTSVATNTNDISTLKSTVSGHTDSISALDETVNNANSGLVKKVADNAGNISDLQNTVGNASSGLVKDVSTLQATVGNASSGLVKDVSSLQTTVGEHTTAIGTINTSITDINSSISSLSTVKANVDLDNISDTGKAAVRGLAKESVKVVAGTYTTVNQGTDGNADAYSVSVTADGVVDSNNTGLVTGGAVFSALSAYAKADGATLSNATLTGTTISSGSIAEEVKLGGADSTITVGSLKTSVADNTSEISALQTTIGDTESGLIKDVADNKKAITDNKKAITTTGITFTGDTGTSGAVKLDGTLAVNGDSNITTEATDGKVAIKLKNSIDLGNEGSMTIGNATLNTSGLVIGTAASLGASGLTVGKTSVTNTGLAITGGPSVTSDGIAAGGKKITGVAEGVNDTDAVNKAQMDSKLAEVSAGAAYSGGDGVAISDDRKISLKNGKGLAFATDGTLVVNNGDGLSFDGNKLKVNAGAGLAFDSGALKVNAGDGLTIDTANGNALKVDKSALTGKIENENAGFVTGGDVHSALALKADVSNVYTKAETDSALGAKANVNLDNISDTGKAAVRSLISVAQGNNVTVTKSTSDAGVDTYTISTAGGVTYSAGDGIAISDTNAISVAANGAVEENNTGIVTGGTVYSALQAFKPDGKVEEGNAKAVSGGTVFTAIETAKTDVNAATETKIATAKTEISSDVETKLGSYAKTDGATLNNATLTGATTVTSLTDGTATLSGGALTGVTTITASGAISGGMATVSGLTVGETNVTTALTTTGAVAENNAGFVTGGAVYNALQAFKPDGKVEEGDTKAVSGDTVYKVTSGLDARITENTNAIGNLQNMVGDANSGLVKDVADSKTDISSLKSTVGDENGGLVKDVKDNKNSINALATTVGDANSGLVKDVADSKTDISSLKSMVGNENTGLVKDVNDLKNASQKITTDDQGNTKVDGTLVVEDTIVVQGKDVTTQLSSDGEVKDNNHGYVDGDKVYEYLNKGENGEVKLAAESKQIAMGQGSEASGSESISIGNAVGGQKNEAKGKQSIAIGFGNQVTGDHSGAIGDPTIVDANNSYAIGNNSKIGGTDNKNNVKLDNVFVIGNNSEVNGSNTVVLGSNVKTSASNAVVLGDGSVGVDNAVSVGAPGNERQIKNVAPGTEATDVATMGQVYTVAQNINKVDNRLNKVGAGAAALAALHPIDTDDKFTMGLGYGNYRSAHAMAMGMFYRPTEKIMISVGGAFGNGENMVNAGISFALDKGKGFGTSKAVMAKNIKALSAENAAIKEENAGMKKQLDAQGQEIAALKAALARLEAKIGK
ncbi:MAG: YadA-like family protein [Acutalibacteraceae bacterium]|nr:YadA-like family protein [Acutalibacteraceae bacterium]